MNTVTILMILSLLLGMCIGFIAERVRNKDNIHLYVTAAVVAFITLVIEYYIYLVSIS